MLYITYYSFRNPITEESQKRFMSLFAHWKLPKGVTWKSHHVNIDGSGGVILSEADSVEAMLESAAPWNPFLEMRVVPVLEVEKVVPVMMGVYAWRDSVKK